LKRDFEEEKAWMMVWREELVWFGNLSFYTDSSTS